MRIYPTRCTLVAVLSLGLTSCASARHAEPMSQTSDTVSAVPRTAYLVVETTTAKAKDECSELAALASPHLKSQPRWILEIKSSASDDSSCTLQIADLSEVPTPLWSVIEEVLSFAISTYSQKALEVVGLMISMLEQMRAHLAEMTNEQRADCLICAGAGLQ